MRGPNSNAIGSAGAYVTLSRTIAAGTVTIIDATGNYVACLASSLTSFLISLDAQGQSFMAKGIKVRAPLGEVFKSIVIDNSQNATALTFTLAIGVGDVSDTRTTFAPAGELLDTFTAAGQAFGTRMNQGGVAAQFTAHGIFNGAATGINAFIRRIRIVSDTTDVLLISVSNAAFAVGGTPTFINKQTNGPAPKVTPCNETNAIQDHFWAGATGIFDFFPVTANVLAVYEPKGCLEATPGFGWALWAQVVNTNIKTFWEWDEH